MTPIKISGSAEQFKAGNQIAIFVPGIDAYLAVKSNKAVKVETNDGQVVDLILQQKRFGTLADMLPAFGHQYYAAVGLPYDISIVADDLRALYPDVEDVTHIDAITTVIVAKATTAALPSPMFVPVPVQLPS